MAKNKPYTLSYMRKRLIENNIIVQDVVCKYPSNNSGQYWTLCLSPRKERIMLHCYKCETEFWFEMCKCDSKLKIKTQSASVICNIAKVFLIKK